MSFLRCVDMLGIVKTVRTAALPVLFALVAGGASFSHKKHSDLKLACVTCHATALKSVRAGFPNLAVCQGCHDPVPGGIDTIPSTRVYRLADFVIFSHARHTAKEAGAVECARCHGPVYEREALTAEVEHSMKACIACHRERKAAVNCVACHELGQ
ncbi:MAG: cytochrome c3 family protein [Bryobacteraceae bacterium]